MHSCIHSFIRYFIFYLNHSCSSELTLSSVSFPLLLFTSGAAVASFCRRFGGGVETTGSVSWDAFPWMRCSQSRVSTRPTVSANRRESTSVREAGRSTESSPCVWIAMSWRYIFFMYRRVVLRIRLRLSIRNTFRCYNIKKGYVTAS